MVAKNRRTFELKLGKLGVTLFVGGMSVLLFAMFFLGVLVGEHLDAYPERYAGGLTELLLNRFSSLAIVLKPLNRPSAGDAPPDGEKTQGKGEFGLTFYKVLGENNDGRHADKGPSAKGNDTNGGFSLPPGSAAGDSPPAAETIPPAPLPDKGVPNKVHSVNSPSEREEKKDIVGNNKKLQEEKTIHEPSAGQDSSDADKNVLKGGFLVQAAAYTDVHQAEKMLKRLKNIGFYPTIQPKEIPGKGRWFRVIAGEFEDRSKAELAARRINKKIKGLKCVIRSNKGGGA